MQKHRRDRGLRYVPNHGQVGQLEKLLLLIWTERNEKWKLVPWHYGVALAASGIDHPVGMYNHGCLMISRNFCIAPQCKSEDRRPAPQ